MAKLNVSVAKSKVGGAAGKKVETALKSALARQLGKEARTLGHAPGTAAIHGMTGVSTKQGAKVRTIR